ncbi:hypothetical protein MKW94_002974 [Papaver nudicaule]|uniref:Uncharacterized protein n=1 Tax=Papaver nudicaule TaxID=74823 RepID=A0AA42B1J1_PAPNU|nr:hypothetical protein [Papaver nudicaule]
MVKVTLKESSVVKPAEETPKVLLWTSNMDQLNRNASGRIEIDCTGEGVIFVEAGTDSLIEDLGELTPSEQLMPLVPNIDYDDIYSCPPFLVQVCIPTFWFRQPYLVFTFLPFRKDSIFYLCLLFLILPF